MFLNMLAIRIEDVVAIVRREVDDCKDAGKLGWDRDGGDGTSMGCLQLRYVGTRHSSTLIISLWCSPNGT